MNRRIGGREGRGIDPRLLLVGGVLAVGLVVLVVVLLFAGGASAQVGERQVDDGGGHIADGSAGGPYDSVPATSGPHWNTPANWGVYSLANPAAESQVVHNLEHGGVVIWYQPGQASEEDVAALTSYVQQQVQSAKFKVILSPWTGEDFGHPIAVTAWNWLLYLDSADTSKIRTFLNDHYGDAPEPYGGPGQPAG
jgi:hypothetical protein